MSIYEYLFKNGYPFENIGCDFDNISIFIICTIHFIITAKPHIRFFPAPIFQQYSSWVLLNQLHILPFLVMFSQCAAPLVFSNGSNWKSWLTQIPWQFNWNVRLMRFCRVRRGSRPPPVQDMLVRSDPCWANPAYLHWPEHQSNTGEIEV